MPSNGFIVDASEAERLAADIAAKTAQLKAVIDEEITKAGKAIQQAAKERAPHGPHTKRIAGSVGRRVTKSQSGATAVVELRDKLGSVLVFGTSTNAGNDFMKPGLDDALPPLESALMDAVSRIVDEQ